MGKIDVNKLRAAKKYMDQIKDPKERAAFGRAFMQGQFRDLAEWRKKHPKKKGLFGKIVGGVKKGLGAAGKIGGKIGKGIAKGVKAGVMFGLKIVGNTALLPITPYIPMMRKAIKKKGKAPNKSSLLGLAKQFHKVVLKKEGYDCYDGNYLDMDSYEKNYVDPVSVKALVAMVLKYVQGLKDKEASGEELTKKEQDILDAVKKGEEAVKEGATEAAEGAVGNWFNRNKTFIIIGVGLASATILGLAGYAMSKGKKG